MFGHTYGIFVLAQWSTPSQALLNGILWIIDLYKYLSQEIELSTTAFTAFAGADTTYKRTRVHF